MRNPAPQIRPPESPLAPNAVKTSILLVDDRPEDLAAMELVLADLGLLFKAFARLGSEQRFPGTGLGLLIVRKAVERMGGSAGVESAAGKGSTFWIELPSAGTTSLTEEPGGCR